MFTDELMCWHRHAPHPAFLKPSPSLNVYHDLRFVWCYKAHGFIVPISNLNYCQKCYYVLQTTRNIKLNYEHFNLHFLVDGHQDINLMCQNCESNLLIKSPIVNCEICTREHLSLLTNAQQSETQLSDYPVAIICHRGQEFLLKEDWSLLILPGT
jgi:hypothetical protein